MATPMAPIQRSTASACGNSSGQVRWLRPDCKIPRCGTAQQAVELVPGALQRMGWVSSADAGRTWSLRRVA